MEWLTLKEAAKIVNKSELTIKRLIDNSKIDQTTGCYGTHFQ